MDGFTGNTLNVWNYHGSPVTSVQSFEYYNFLMPSNVANGDTLLTVTGTADMDDINSLGKQASVSGVNVMGGGTVLNTGDRITLLRAGTGISGTLANAGTYLTGTKGVSLQYTYLLEQTATELAATVLDVSVNPQTKSLSEGRVAGLAFVNQGADLATGLGMSAARHAGSGLGAFAVGQGGTSRYHTGSHVDVDGFSLMAGIAWNQDTECGKLLLGAFFEGGWGDYDSHNSFSNAASVKGNGDTNYYGGGVLGRFDFKNNIYTEASFRIGQLDTDFGSSNLRDPLGNRASYDSSSTYYGAHLGLGYIWNITDATSLDLSTKYLWTRQDSDSVTVAGDPIKFKASDSHRWRTGARVSHAITTEGGLTFKPYIGAAYEHEFDGKAKATTYGYSIDAPDLKGGTGIGELGLTFKPSADCGLSLDLGVQGYVGVREGVTGSFQLKWEF
jgi:outer membrane autotransporter barrel domain